MGYVIFVIALFATAAMYACCKMSGEFAMAEEEWNRRAEDA